MGNLPVVNSASSGLIGPGVSPVAYPSIDTVANACSVKISGVPLTPALVQVINRRVVQGEMISRLEMLLLIPATVRFGASLRCTLLAAGLPEAVEV
jgi:hypothetical protein